MNMKKRHVADDERRYYGWFACKSILKFRPKEVLRVYVDKNLGDEAEPVRKACAEYSIEFRKVLENDLERLTKTTHHQGICVVAKEKEFLTADEFLSAVRQGEEIQTIIYLDGVENPHNIGAILRTAAHFGIRYILGPGNMPRMSPAACRTSEGAADLVTMVPLGQPSPIFAELCRIGFQVVSTETRRSQSIYRHKFSKKTVLIMGSEVHGVSPEISRLAQHRVNIPGTGWVQSLNVTVSTAISLSEIQRQMLIIA